MAVGKNWKQLMPHIDDASGRGRTDISSRDRFVNFLDPKLYYKEFSQSEEDVLEESMVKYFPERINPPPSKKLRRYALFPKEWKFIASKFRSSANKQRTPYQVKRTWYIMRRKYKTNQRSLPKKGWKCGLNKENLVKVGMSKPMEKKTRVTIKDHSIHDKRRSPISSKGNDASWKKPQSSLETHAKKTRL